MVGMAAAMMTMSLYIVHTKRRTCRRREIFAGALNSDAVKLQFSGDSIRIDGAQKSRYGRWLIYSANGVRVRAADDVFKDNREPLPRTESSMHLSGHKAALVAEMIAASFRTRATSLACLLN
jgi:hypothetical protein